MDEEDAPEYDASTPEEDRLVRYDEEKHMFVEDARFIKRDAKVGDEVVFPLEIKDDYGRIAAQTAKQVIVQKIREAEKVSVLAEYGEIEGTIVSGTVERVERGTIFVDMGRAIGMLAYNEQIPGERYKQGERMRAYLVRVEETVRGVFLRLSRSHPKFLEKLFEAEVPEIAGGTVEVKAIAREAGMRSKIAVFSHDEHVDPVGALVGQQGVRVQTIMAELHGEKIDIVEWSPDTEEFIHDALSPAKVVEVELNEQMQSAKIFVTEDQQSLAIGKGGQNARLAAKLTGWKIDISSIGGDEEVRKVEDEK
jgi:N utilization substance protein A